MPKFKDDKKMVRGDSDFQFSKTVIFCKWFDNKLVRQIIGKNYLRNGWNVMRRTKGSDKKTPAKI